MDNIDIRKAVHNDLPFILNIYNQGIEDRIATLDQDLKTMNEIEIWFQEHQGRYSVLVAESKGKIAGWASLNPYSHRCAYQGVADLSVYVDRSFRSKGVGSFLLQSLEKTAKENEFYKIVLYTFPFNELGQSLYKKMGYRKVGTFKNQGILDEQYVDVMAMEKLL
ncbi:MULTISPECIES: arsinothricin resistance N-acetyltransferase ArsN1 family A [Bacillus]|uniref:N-acetyltransferase n=1 Tax=Bacillus swezeyi TaxID=1925020 RepID=A0A5M8RTL4_9BACI|nr:MULTISPECIES: arsinothricin resistance N-acetyltransferase ArsN1 family A [Bacillus]KAA6451279.1 N-acetyltransferase [Bacillus swezeyi]KAA6482006.1 N-acetyltransferase [Bacillus swezeyi]MCY8641083.1 arsinothricin resistance N-acetyltransferase ArsN1 [Bacillus haynesii]MCY8667161.1 arsinothricin resistance N-acetyltransferase ArsN1 [Bacillus haynesii]MCY9434900.1 arsinothricin resistance N-acetyltransferase ArsN1 [Bacillus haynesii]